MHNWHDRLFYLSKQNELQLMSTIRFIGIAAVLLVFTDINAQTNFQRSNFSISTPAKSMRKIASGKSSVLLGDVDGSGTLTVDDVTELKQYIIQSDYSLAHSELADMDRDGDVDIADVALLIDVLLRPDRDLCNGYEYVDLGLSVKWATCNINADDPQLYGGFFAWGENEEKDTYLWEYYKYETENYNNWEGCSKYQIADGKTGGIWYDGNTFIGDNKQVLDDDDDAATATWGQGWRIPTKEEFEELLDECSWTWISDSYRKGYLVARNGRSIFIPASGCAYSQSFYGTGSYGYYWTKCLTKSYTQYAYSLYINKNEKQIGFDERSYGLSIRPVCP